MIKDIKIDSFSEICSSFSIWIIEYCSRSYGNPLYMVWYTDMETKNSERDAFMLDKTGCVFALSSLEDIKKIVLQNVKQIRQPENLQNWLACFGNLQPEYNASYDVGRIEDSIRSRNLSDDSIELFANFIDLFADFVYQSEENRLYERDLKNDYINKVWKYYYEYIFFPRFSDNRKYHRGDKPKLEINYMELLHAFIKIRYILEENIKEWQVK